MKVFALLVCALLVLSFSSPLEGRLFLTSRIDFFCVWTAKRSCSKTTPVCVFVQVDATPTYSCKYYRNECKYSIDTCLGKTVYGRTGAIDATATRCVAASIPVGGTGTC